MCILRYSYGCAHNSVLVSPNPGDCIDYRPHSSVVSFHLGEKRDRTPGFLCQIHTALLEKAHRRLSLRSEMWGGHRIAKVGKDGTCSKRVFGTTQSHCLGAEPLARNFA